MIVCADDNWHEGILKYVILQYRVYFSVFAGVFVGLLRSSGKIRQPGAFSGEPCFLCIWRAAVFLADSCVAGASLWPDLFC